MDQKRSDFDFDFHHDAADMEYGTLCHRRQLLKPLIDLWAYKVCNPKITTILLTPVVQDMEI
jgi:hypothetical protein